MKAIVLSGVSGVGKTYARQTTPELKHLPHVDIADVYRAFPEMDWRMATHALLKRARAQLEHTGAVVLEGYFLPGSRSRRLVVGALRAAGVEVEVRELWAPLETCIERIKRQQSRGEISAAEGQRRIEMARRCWRPREGH